MRNTPTWFPGAALALALAGLLALPAGAEPRPAAVMYQPQVRDAGTAPEAWDRLFETLHAGGTRELVLQWSRFGDEDFGGRDGWLDGVAERAAEAGLQVRIGLYWDPEWFNRLTDGRTPLDRYLNATMRRNHDQARAWAHWRERDAFAGWYLPAELPDRVFHEADRQAVLADQIGRLHDAIGGDLAVSSYPQGRQTPRGYARWLSDLQRETGVQVHVMDGAGDSALRAAERRAYLQHLPCRLGVVEERFHRISPPEASFRAEPAVHRDSGAADCHPRTLFSLRYLPEAAGVLRY